MNRLVAEIKAGEIGMVITADISRIARTYPLLFLSSPLAMEWRELTRKRGVTFVALADFG